MDKNTIIGFLLIGSLLFGFTWYSNKTSKEEALARQYNDSIAALSLPKQVANTAATIDTTKAVVSTTDSTNTNEAIYGTFAASATGEEKLITVENNLLKITFSNKGGQISSVELKNYVTHDKKPLVLFDSKLDSSNLNFNILTANDRVISTKDMYFEAIGFENAQVKDGAKSFTLRLKTSANAYIDFIYTIKANDYMLDFKIQAYNATAVLPLGTNSLEMQWNSKIRQQEKGRKFENKYATLEYKYIGDDVEQLSPAENESVDEPTKIQWIAFKDQFFSSILISDQGFENSKLTSKMGSDSSEYIKSYAANSTIAFDPTGKTNSSFHFFFGPNQHKVLSAYDDGKKDGEELRLEELIPLGWGIFGWINEFVVIPIFDFFSSFVASFGIIILLLTLVIKSVLFPLTYKSYMSMAKMRVLKPQIDEINAKYGNKMQEKQQATMALYRKVGVNPLGGCLPMLLQMPILFALFSFFPAAIELRQESFLWATDLSSYDAILSWDTQIPILSSIYGNHVSLFCLLMTITNLAYTHLNMQTQMEGSQQIPGMKYMMYAMPVIFLFMFNDYASGLSYYYFIATLITVIQTYAIRKFVNEEKLLNKLHENAKNPKKAKKSGFLARMEEMQKKQIEMQKQQAKRKK